MSSLGHDSSKDKQADEGRGCSRRGLLKGSAAFVVGGSVGAAVGTLAGCSPAPAPDAPPLPWEPSFQNSVGAQFAAEAVHALPNLRRFVIFLQALVFVNGKQVIDEVFLA